MSNAPATSTVYVKAAVSATEEGLTVNPTTATVTMLFSAVGADSPAPDDTNWKTASWETDATRSPDRYYARCLTGPQGGEITFTEGTYWVWVKIDGIDPEVPIIRAGEHVAT
jgi:hypothetical protein